MKFKDFIARVDPQPRPKKVQRIWKPGAKFYVKGHSDTFTIKEVLPYGAYKRLTYPSRPGFNRMVVVSTIGFLAYQDECELV